jgi:hypothetical protein
MGQAQRRSHRLSRKAPDGESPVQAESRLLQGAAIGDALIQAWSVVWRHFWQGKLPNRARRVIANHTSLVH